jgi:hypothetical protein
LNIIQAGEFRDNETHYSSSLGNCEIGKPGFTIECVVIGISIHAFDFYHVFEVDGEAVVLNHFRFITLTVLMSVRFELLVLGGDGSVGKDD